MGVALQSRGGTGADGGSDYQVRVVAGPSDTPRALFRLHLDLLIR